MNNKSLPPLEYLPEASRPAPLELAKRSSKGGYLAEAHTQEQPEQSDFYAEHQKKQV
jgi:hypothetical protein